MFYAYCRAEVSDKFLLVTTLRKMIRDCLGEETRYFKIAILTVKMNNLWVKFANYVYCRGAVVAAREGDYGKIASNSHVFLTVF